MKSKVKPQRAVVSLESEKGARLTHVQVEETTAGNSSYMDAVVGAAWVEFMLL